MADFAPYRTGTTWGFTGHEDEPDTGLINMRGRIYDAELGRFTTPDPFVRAPLSSQGLNRYAYVFNNPLTLVLAPPDRDHPDRPIVITQIAAS